ncbi:MAG TPA: hypothetical protein DCG34_06215 [Clostridiales bacterium]|jgi:hypothetical protein|nr:hypothetical protein [Clostridiales bacterium]
MKNLLMLFGVTLAKRYTKRQKRIFYSQAEPFFRNLNYAVELQEVKKKLLHVSNIYIGDTKKAKYLVVCPYDTPSRSLLPFTYFPFNLSKNLSQENRELLIRSLIYIGSSLLTYFVFRQFLSFSILIKVISIVFFVGLIIFCYRLITGIPNSVNFNRNSASIALIAALAERLAKNRNVAYVLLDNTVSSNTGWRIFAEDESLKNKTIIYIDCVSYGEKLVCAHNQATSIEAKKMVEVLTNVDVIDQVVPEEHLKDTKLQSFPKMLHICTGTIENHNFLVRNTQSKKDFKVDILRLEFLCEGLIKYLGA